VIICAKEYEEKSRLVIVCDRYRVNPPIEYSSQQIKEYLHDKFTVNASLNNLDPQR